MTMQMVGGIHRQVAIDTATPDVQNSTNTDAVVTGSEIDARAWNSVAYTIIVATNAITWTVFGAHAADYSDEVAVSTPASVAAGANSSYTVAPAPFSHYRVKIKSTSAGNHGAARVTGVAKG